MLPKALDFSDRQLEEISACLTYMRWEAEASCVLLADITGQLIESQGRVGRMNTAVLSALAAGNLAATKEMARLVGEEARFKLLVHEGESRSVYLSDVGGELVLISVFGSSTPIGMIRLLTRRTVERLQEILLQAQEQGPVQQDLTQDFGQLLADELDLSLGS
ncbi:MAG: roadblock/LC7 domain-containing protein [Chloroflexia bacterium]|nr:roadblock/LC7 domain-containing protein [Chloroflexia bacterium]